jgi:hypothetical protein
MEEQEMAGRKKYNHYTHSEGEPDDKLHAFIYALIAHAIERMSSPLVVCYRKKRCSLLAHEIRRMGAIRSNSSFSPTLQVCFAQAACQLIVLSSERTASRSLL